MLVLLILERSPVYFKLQGTLDGFTWYDIQTFPRHMKLDTYIRTLVVSRENIRRMQWFPFVFIVILLEWYRALY